MKKIIKKIIAVILILNMVSIVFASNNTEDTSSTNKIEWYLDIAYKNIGDIVKFGNFFQKSTATKEPIEWIILDMNNDLTEALLMSKQVLLKWAYDDLKDKIVSYKDLTWKDSQIRKNLNEYFYNESFNDEEKKMIIEHKIINSNIDDLGRTGGKDTNDKVFILDIDEYIKYIYDPLKNEKTFKELSKNINLKNLDDTVSNYAKPYGASNAKYLNWLRGPYWYRYGVMEFPLCKNKPEGIQSDYSHRLDPKTIAGVRPCIYVKLRK